MVVEFEKQGRLAIITLNRPEARNAISPEVAQAMEAALDEYENDPDLWAAILCGKGKAFCAGADLKAIAAGKAAGIETKRGGFGGLVRRERKKPLIAAIAGSALAGGTEIALSCDLIVCSTETLFGLPEVKRSLVAAAGGLFRLPRAIGMAPALEVILTGDPMPAERAYQLGMVNQVVAPEEVMNAARALADRIIANAPLAVQASRRIASRAFSDEDDALWSASGHEFIDIAKSEDFREGPLAFIEKRKPEWKGR
ncbi:MAG: crotonase/enoyl-CoA hydratase family protein [bacterium]